MKKRLTKHPLPLDWGFLPGADRAIAIRDIRVRRDKWQSRTRLKLLIFRNARDLRRFWKLGLDVYLGPCDAAVHDLSCTVEDYKGPKREARYDRVDPNFFAVMGLVLKSAGQEVVTHESVHAAFHFNERHPHKRWPNDEDGDPSFERICYPAGIIARQVAGILMEVRAKGIGR